MTVCRTCHLPWDNMNSHFTVCPSCRAKMPVRRVNTKKDKPFRLMPFNYKAHDALEAAHRPS